MITPYDQMAMRFVEAHDSGDLEAIANLWALAAKDPALGEHLKLVEDGLLAELDAVLQAAPADHQAQTRRGCTLARLERYDEAQAAFGKAVADAGHFIYPRLVSFDADMWALVSGPARALAPPQTALAPRLVSRRTV